MNNKILLTKTDGLIRNEWEITLVAEARKDGYLFDLTANSKALNYYYDSDYSPEDAWREVFEESQPC